MLIKSALMSVASGTLGGLTAIRCKSGMSLRAKAKQTNKRSERQMVIRNIVKELSSAWVTLTQDQRDDWNQYAKATPMTNKLGMSRTLSGFSHYLRSNTPRLQGGLLRRDNGPDRWGQADPCPLQTLTAYSDFGIDAQFCPNASWRTEDGAAILLYIGQPQNVTINFFRSSWRLANVTLGSSTSPPPTSIFFSPPYTLTPGQRIWLYTRVTRADGRLSPPSFHGPSTVISLF